MKTKTVLKNFLDLLEKDQNNTYGFLKLLFEEFSAHAGTVSKKKFLQDLVCNDEFNIDIYLYFQLAEILDQEIDIENVKYILTQQNYYEIVENIQFLERELEEEETTEKLEEKKENVAKEVFIFFIKEKIPSDEKLSPEKKEEMISFFEKNFPHFI